MDVQMISGDAIDFSPAIWVFIAAIAMVAAYAVAYAYKKKTAKTACHVYAPSADKCAQCDKRMPKVIALVYEWAPIAAFTLFWFTFIVFVIIVVTTPNYDLEYQKEQIQQEYEGILTSEQVDDIVYAFRNDTVPATDEDGHSSRYNPYNEPTPLGESWVEGDDGKMRKVFYYFMLRETGSDDVGRFVLLVQNGEEWIQLTRDEVYALANGEDIAKLTAGDEDESAEPQPTEQDTNTENTSDNDTSKFDAWGKKLGEVTGKAVDAVDEIADAATSSFDEYRSSGSGNGGDPH